MFLLFMVDPLRVDHAWTLKLWDLSRANLHLRPLLKGKEGAEIEQRKGHAQVLGLLIERGMEVKTTPQQQTCESSLLHYKYITYITAVKPRPV